MIKVLMTLMGMEIGGAETHVLELSKTLKHMGVDVHVVSNGGVYVQELEECGITHYQVPLHNKQFINVFSSYRAIRKIIEENDIRLVHAHARIPAFICGLLQRKLKFRLVTTAHQVFSLTFPFNKLTNWGDKVLAVSGDIKEYLLDNYTVEEQDISLTINGIDTDKFAADADASHLAEELGLSNDTRKIVSISRLDITPNLNNTRPLFVLIEAAAELVKETPIEVIIVGDGNDFKSVKDAADAANHKFGQKFIHMTGSRTDISRFLAIADIDVNVSRSAMEAMSAGVPVVLSGGQGYLGIFEESILDKTIATNFTCRGYEIATAEDLSRDLRILLAKSHNELAEMGAYNRNVIQQQYSILRMATDAVKVYENVMSAPPVHFGGIVISGYYGYNNSGDDIILKSIVQNVRDYIPDLPITVLSNNPKETRALFNVDAVYRFNLFSVFWRLLKAGILITGGGNLIQDETSTRSLFYYLGIINTAGFLGAKNMIYAKGIGPVGKPSNISRVRRSLNRVDLITLREPESLEALNEIGVNRPEIHVTADAAFALKPAEGGEAYLAALGITQPFFCVALRSWAHNPPDMEAQVARFVDYTIETYGYQALFIPMRPEEDNGISKRVIALMKHPAVLAQPAPHDYDQVRAIMGLADFALCMRLHALIFAMEKGVPTVGLVYSPKIRQFLETMGQHWHMPVEETNAELLIKYADTIHADKEAISAAIYKAGCRLREKSSQNALLCAELIKW